MTLQTLFIIFPISYARQFFASFLLHQPNIYSAPVGNLSIAD